MRYLLVLLLVACTPVKDQPELYRIANQTVVKITSENGSGSGVLIDPYHVLTAYHVVEGMEGLVVSTQDQSFTTTGEIVHSDGGNDLAILWLEKPSPHYIPVSTDMPPELSKVHAIGFPMGGRLVMTDSRYQGPVEGTPDHAITSPISFGNSGGPVIWYDPKDKRYEVIGIIVTVRGTPYGPVAHMGQCRGVDTVGPLTAQL